MDHYKREEINRTLAAMLRTFGAGADSPIPVQVPPLAFHIIHLYARASSTVSFYSHLPHSQ